MIWVVRRMIKVAHSLSQVGIDAAAASAAKKVSRASVDGDIVVLCWVVCGLFCGDGD